MKINIDGERKIVIPGAICKNLGIRPGDSFHIQTSDKGILLTPLQHEKKYDSESVFVFSGKKEGTSRYFTLK